MPSAAKGQYRVVVETALILVGILITAFVISSFGNVRETAANITLEDNYNTVASHVLTGIIKASLNPGYAVKLGIPETIGGETYRIALEDERITVSGAGQGISVSRQIFNIDQNHRITRSEALSSSRAVEIINEISDGVETIRIRRG